MKVNERYFNIADAVAAAHTKQRLFESLASATVRKIKLRTDIYWAMEQAAPSPALQDKEAGE